MKYIALVALVLIGAAIAPPADAKTVEFHEFGGNVYGSDGTKIHEYAGKTYVTDPKGHETRCERYAGKTYCEAN